MLIYKLAAEWKFGAFISEYLILLGSKLLAPLFIGFDNFGGFIFHNYSVFQDLYFGRLFCSYRWILIDITVPAQADAPIRTRNEASLDKNAPW